MTFLNNIVAFFMAIIAFLSSIFGMGASKKKINLDNFDLVWSDEFDGTELDRTKWKTHDSTGLRKGGYWNGALQQVADGNLTIYSKYLENGVDSGDPAGWYTSMVETEGLFEQTYGYFETRCILPKGYGQWSAFWMMNNDAMANPYESGAMGAEIDIFEAPHYGKKINNNEVDGAIHWGGYGDAHKVIGVYHKPYPNDPYNTFNTYGLEWNEDAYIFYINGEEVERVSKDEVEPSAVPEYLILSVEVSGQNGIPMKGWPVGTMDDNGKDFTSEFIIDYVRVYQYK